MQRICCEKLVEQRGWKDCEECAREKMRKDCELCGDGIDEEDLEMCLLGLDVVSLFSATKEKNSGRILRKQAVKNPMIVKGFKWKEGARYITINKDT